jgi:glycosyltransferase involved in cell wall biosynthesis
MDAAERQSNGDMGDHLKVILAYPKWRFSLPPTDLSFAMEVVGHELGRRLARHADVALYRRGPTGEPRVQVIEDVQYRRVGARTDRTLTRLVQAKEHVQKRLGSYKPTRPFTSAQIAYLDYAIHVAMGARRWHAQIVHLSIYDSLIPVIRRLNPDIGIVLHMHDHSQVQRDRDRVAHHLAAADAIVGCSDFITQQAKNRFPDLSDRCTTILNAVDTDLYQPASDPDPDRPPTILYYGRLSPEKGVHVVLDAFRQVVAAIPSATLLIAGQAALAGAEFVDPFGSDALFADLGRFWGRGHEYRQYLESLIDDTMRPRVRFVGPVANRDTVTLLHQSDVLVFPSLWHEPFGLPVIEAMAAGVPVVASRGGAFPETVVDGETGLLVERGDVDGLANALITVLGDQETRRNMGKAARARAEEVFSWDKAVFRWLDLYEQILT